MNKKILFGLLAIFTITVFCFAKSKDDVIEQKPVVSMLKEFYSLYVKEVFASTPPNVSKGKEVMKKYCTDYLMKSVDAALQSGGTESDPFTNSKAFYKEMLDSMTIEQDSVKPNLFYVDYQTAKHDKDFSVELLVVKEKGKYKIDQIVDL